jgi:hypothetical protein
MKHRSITIAVLGITALLGTLYAFGWLLVLFLFVPLLVCALAVGFPGAYPDYDKTEAAAQRDVWRKRALTISLSLGSVCTLVFGVLTWGYLSWPNRGTWGVVWQAPLLMSMIYQYQYLGIAWRGKRLPSKVWPMRVIAITMGGMFGMMLIPVQVDLAEEWFQDRQKSLLARLDVAPDHCAAFKLYLAENTPSGKFETPDLYHGAVENVYGGRPLYVLAFRARADMESMIVYYYSGSKKWITTFRDNERGMKGFRETIDPLVRCDGPGERIVRLRTEDARP